ncbi:TetR/AcrR family transcriptional regulator [Burkholderia oklahomensis]|uniref:TetR/AcrR family transcriptional regulator n=1 Tax=Burkholderia oklahomensis TaxID=342113 RepID=UPI00016A97CE|nr:TetR/AcrR family transcriptional regulator [Burkholderia oklahomensis]AJX34308.1 bacterial regulatory s, tetR family protein [Burkholderia oklahomensis C6786]AOI48839.1 TetR family transcriptional regulator [Burkholderia oklahomensis C6786]KUY50559.1 TetR family transcriptional regulator [Burkholderia oklahomensis C6786]MBI0362959.1 TetR/AcrR family transcriptional regulator [Burkholderia oklahomensis]SUY27062.1 transcriptional repressor BetI [Burkholderia oklahomensis]
MARTTRTDWIAAGLAALDDEGARGISADRLARRLGVTRGAFYHHFGSRKAFVQALLAEWETTYTTQAIALLQRDGPPERALDRYLAAASQMNPRREAAIRTWSLHEPLVAEFQRRADRARLAAAHAFCRQTLRSEEDAALFAQVSYLCFVGAQQSALPMGPDDFTTLFRALLALGRRLPAAGEDESDAKTGAAPAPARRAKRREARRPGNERQPRNSR